MDGSDNFGFTGQPSTSFLLAMEVEADMGDRGGGNVCDQMRGHSFHFIALWGERDDL